MFAHSIRTILWLCNVSLLIPSFANLDPHVFFSMVFYHFLLVLLFHHPYVSNFDTWLSLELVLRPLSLKITVN